MSETRITPSADGSEDQPKLRESRRPKPWRKIAGAAAGAALVAGGVGAALTGGGGGESHPLPKMPAAEGSPGPESAADSKRIETFVNDFTDNVLFADTEGTPDVVTTVMTDENGDGYQTAKDLHITRLGNDGELTSGVDLVLRNKDGETLHVTVYGLFMNRNHQEVDPDQSDVTGFTIADDDFFVEPVEVSFQRGAEHEWTATVSVGEDGEGGSFSSVDTVLGIAEQLQNAHRN